MRTRPPGGPEAARPQGSVLIIVLWIAFGLVALALYFAQTMGFELRAADNRVASLEAEYAVMGAARYISNLLATTEQPGQLPNLGLYDLEAVPIGQANVWVIGRSDGTSQNQNDDPVFGLVDEAGKLNLNTATLEMLELLPGMTPELAAAIIDWRDEDSDVSSGGAESEVYQRLNPPYLCKNAKFESVEELRLVNGMTMDLLFGEDANRNGVLEANERDGDLSPPYDDSDGWLDPGLLEYLTIYSAEPNTRTNGESRINVGTPDSQTLSPLLQEYFSAERVTAILGQLGLSTSTNGQGGTGGPSRPGSQGPGNGGAAAPPTPAATTTTPTNSSVLEFYIRSGMTAEEFAQIEADLTVSTNDPIVGLVNVNTASEAVLACLPGIGTEFAPTLVAHRQSNQAGLTQNPSLAWVVDVLGQTNAIAAGPYLTARTYQCTADIAALGHFGRGYHRTAFVFDMAGGLPRIRYRQDLTHLGWALGREIRTQRRLAQYTR